MTVTYEKLPYASELVPVTPWLPDNSDEDHVVLRRLFTRECDDGAYAVLQLFVCVNEERVYSTLLEAEQDVSSISMDVSLECSNGDTWDYVMYDAPASKFAGRPITDESLADWLNLAIAPWVPLALEDSITEEIVRKARSVSDYSANTDAVMFLSAEDHEQEDVDEEDAG